MYNRFLIVLSATVLWLFAAVLPAQAVETRVNSFSMTCDGTNKTVSFLATNLGASVNRFVVAASIAISAPRGGLSHLRLQVAGDPKKTLLLMGFNQVSASTNSIGAYLTPTNASGNVSFQLAGACRGGGALQGFTNILFN